MNFTVAIVTLPVKLLGVWCDLNGSPSGQSVEAGIGSVRLAQLLFLAATAAVRWRAGAPTSLTRVRLVPDLRLRNGPRRRRLVALLHRHMAIIGHAVAAFRIARHLIAPSGQLFLSAAAAVWRRTCSLVPMAAGRLVAPLGFRCAGGLMASRSSGCGRVAAALVVSRHVIAPGSAAKTLWTEFLRGQAKGCFPPWTTPRPHRLCGRRRGTNLVRWGPSK